MAEPIDLSFGFLDSGMLNFNHICQVVPMCPYRKAHWRHLSNTIELSVCGRDAAVCQITLTTCWYLLHHVHFADLQVIAYGGSGGPCVTRDVRRN